MNIQHLLRLERPMLFFDLESTTDNTPMPNFKSDRIVEIGLIQFKPDGSTMEWKTLVNPGVLITAASTEKHGITIEMMGKCNKCHQTAADHPNEKDGCPEFRPVPMFSDIAESLLRGFTNTDFGGYNIKTYDLPLIQAEFLRAGFEWKYDDARILDGFRLWQVAEPRTLTDFVKRWSDKTLDDAHHALADIQGTLQGIVDLITTVQHLPRDLGQLHELLWPPRPKDPNWIDGTGKFIWKKGVATVNFGKKWNDKPMHLVAQRFWQWMIDPAQSFDPDAVEIARNMLAGKLPKYTPPEEVPVADTPVD